MYRWLFVCMAMFGKRKVYIRLLSFVGSPSVDWCLCISTSKRGSNVLLNDVYPNEYHCWIAAYFFNDLSWRYYHPIFFLLVSFVSSCCCCCCFFCAHSTHSNKPIPVAFKWRCRRNFVSQARHFSKRAKKKQFVDSSHLHQIRWHFSFLIFASFTTCANVILGVDWLRSECDMFLEYEIFLKHFVSEKTRTRPLFANVSMGFSANRAANRWSQMLK